MSFADQTTHSRAIREAIRDRRQIQASTTTRYLMKGWLGAVCRVPPSLLQNYLVTPCTARSSCGVPSVFDQSSKRTPIITPMTISAPAITFLLTVSDEVVLELKARAQREQDASLAPQERGHQSIHFALPKLAMQSFCFRGLIRP